MSGETQPTLAAFDRDGPAALAFEQTGGPPPPSARTPKPG